MFDYEDIIKACCHLVAEKLLGPENFDEAVSVLSWAFYAEQDEPVIEEPECEDCEIGVSCPCCELPWHPFPEIETFAEPDGSL